eukprot:TRINITY_DN6523_c0_g1_i1.p1 TRINITY_DN6523_c0_g1~~TRINITY_DN6523_c0_g1_i1.p1  ORF type:complete len:166 (-),score=19.65 TRINITY_DN6523_c0_g1_i1:61-558(-)
MQVGGVPICGLQDPGKSRTTEHFSKQSHTPGSGSPHWSQPVQAPSSESKLSEGAKRDRSSPLKGSGCVIPAEQLPHASLMHPPAPAQMVGSGCLARGEDPPQSKAGRGAASLMHGGGCMMDPPRGPIHTSRRLCQPPANQVSCLLYTSDAADEEDSVDLGGRRII